ncbi:MAG: diacylglycerol kinase family protein [Acidimicrobiales bacterium]
MSATVAIWNPASGGAADEADLRAALGDAVDLRETTEDDPGQGQTERAVADGADLLVACGGDGTVRACLDALAGTDTALAIVPLGTGNLLASNLGLATGLDAADDAGRGTPFPIDLGRINGEAFAVMAGTGFDAAMIDGAPSGLKSRIGSLAYVVSCLRNLHSRLVATTVEVDGRPWLRTRTSMVLVGNFGTVSGGLAVFPDAEPDDGLLDVAVTAASTPRQWLAWSWRLLRRRPEPPELVQRTRGRRIVVAQNRARPYELDGEVRPATRRLEIEVVPGALTIDQKGASPTGEDPEGDQQKDGTTP